MEALLEPIEHTLDETKGYELLAKAALEAFAALDKQGTFGTGKQRERLLLIIDTSFAEKDWTLPSIKRLNPSAGLKRYEEQTRIEGVYASCDTLAFSPDGRTLFFAGHRETDPVKEKRVDEFVGCDVVGLRVKRRWTYPASHLNGFRDIACDQDGTTVLAIANQSIQGKESTALMRFQSMNGKQIQNHPLSAGAQALAFSGDGGQIAVATLAKLLHVCDQDFNELQTVKLKTYPFTLLPLRSGELLVGTKAGLERVDKNSKVAFTPFKKGIFRLSRDKSERVMLVSRLESDWNAEFGFQVFKLPALKVQRTVTIPGHQLNQAVLSPDGKFAACVATKIGKGNTFIVILETKKFREIARRNADRVGVSDLKFSPDSALVAFTKRGYTTTEPVVLWRFPHN
jgi:hypothetical protein